ncbi:E3 ubiquitin-protein ligase RNF31 [Halotydeus destructor]|nr:E3 ubiquitin-protein ligase RNF31 [Halotydeus destructor]
MPRNRKKMKCGSSVAIPTAKKFQCKICFDHFGIDDMFAMLHCSHLGCNDCMKKYFTNEIQTKRSMAIGCPECQLPKLEANEEERLHDYTSLLDLKLRPLVEPHVHDLFQRKLCNLALSKDKNFRWCVNCPFGFTITREEFKNVQCTECETMMCIDCGVKWDVNHEGVSCEQFKKDRQDKDSRLVDNYLKRNGVDCPNCSCRFELSRGGCIHHTCLQCRHEFCISCKAPYWKNLDEAQPESHGLYADHPRNCYSRLRDLNVTDLEDILKKEEICYPFQNHNSVNQCSVSMQKESSGGHRDEDCGSRVFKFGYCKVHYVESLCQLIMEHKVDPVEAYTSRQVKQMLKREGVQLTGYETRKKLLRLVRNILPL